MKSQTKIKWIFLFSFFLVLSAFATTHSQAQSGFVGTQTCINCHSTWEDNNPLTQDTISDNANLPDYVPLNLRATHAQQQFYTIPEGYVSSIHNLTPAEIDINPDHVKCEGCHGSGLAHFGVGPIPTPIPGIDTCRKCHNDNSAGAPFFPLNEFLLTRHANSNRKPSRYFDQGRNGVGQAITTARTPEEPVGLALFKSDASTIVTKNERIEECSVCHNYALTYPQFVKKIAQNNLPKKPTVSCGACHDAHIPAPDGIEPAIFTVSSVTVLSGSTVISSAPVPRSTSYLNHKPYKIAADGAQDQNNGVWTRGSAIARPTFSIVQGVGTLGVSGSNNILTFAGGGFQGNVKEFNTVLISGTASATANLPADAVNAGAPVTVKATLDRAGFEVLSVTNDNTLVFTPAPSVTATVIYKKTAGGTANLSVPITFTGSINFDIRDMYTNTENLCGSCHAQGTYKFSAVGLGQGGLVDVGKTHNIDVLGQYLTSGHRNRLAPPFEEFSAFVFAGSHQAIYPFDQSITGSGGVGSLRNRGNRAFELTQTPNSQNAYLVTPGNTMQPVATSTSLACNQCHHGLGSIDFQKDVQGTPDASVLWGDATHTCWTCHEPHASKIDANVRLPVKLSINPRFVDPVKNPRGSIDKFLDGTNIPSGVGTGKICLFCHQGRESGLTVYMNISGRGVDPYTDPDKIIAGGAGISFQNPHYLESGAVLWSKNTWEFTFNGVPQRYSSGIPLHQQQNCTGCHMGEASPNGLEGGHTWRPRIEVCQQCHPGVNSFPDIPASADFDGDGVVESAFAEIGTIGDPVLGDSGLFGQLKAALAAKGISYNPNSYPYFFTATGGSFTAWTSNTLAAAFNLSFFFKSGNCSPYHNVFYTAQILQDSLRALAVTPTGVRPAGDRNATDYRTIVVNP